MPGAPEKHRVHLEPPQNVHVSQPVTMEATGPQRSGRLLSLPRAKNSCESYRIVTTLLEHLLILAKNILGVFTVSAPQSRHGRTKHLNFHWDNFSGVGNRFIMVYTRKIRWELTRLQMRVVPVHGSLRVRNQLKARAHSSVECFFEGKGGRQFAIQKHGQDFQSPPTTCVQLPKVLTRSATVRTIISPSSPRPRGLLEGCSSPFMRLAGHITALRAWCKQCLSLVDKNSMCSVPAY